MLESPRMTSTWFLNLPSTTSWKRWDGLYSGQAQVSTWEYLVIIFCAGAGQDGWLEGRNLVGPFLAKQSCRTLTSGVADEACIVLLLWTREV